VRHRQTLEDNVEPDIDKREGIIIVGVPTDASWAPPPGAPVRSRRYGLVAWETNEQGQLQMASAPSIQSISVRLATEIANSMEALKEQLTWVTKSTATLKHIYGNAKLRNEWDSTAKTVWTCAGKCLTEYSGFLIDSNRMQAAKTVSLDEAGTWAFRHVAGDLALEVNDLYAVVGELPADEQKLYLDQLAVLRSDIAQIQKTPPEYK
jgi:hypothetical protein